MNARGLSSFAVTEKFGKKFLVKRSSIKLLFLPGNLATILVKVKKQKNSSCSDLQCTSFLNLNTNPILHFRNNNWHRY